MEKKNALTLLQIQVLRPAQNEILNVLTAGRDAVCILPTGGGKSAIFQLLALTLERLVVVIEPHLALEIDQVRQLRKWDISAAFINSTQSPEERRRALEKIRDGSLRLLYLTPEMLQNQIVANELKHATIGGLMLDEAHCIVKQGPGFREDYLRIPDFVRKLHTRPVVGAFTATATPATEAQIIDKLKMQSPFVYRGSVTRANVRLSVIEIGRDLGGRKDAAVIEQRKREEIRHLLKKQMKKSGKVIIYCNTVKRVKQLAKHLKKKGFPVDSFYGACEKKAERLQRFASGDVRVMVATNAFGLGVNIPDIRLVIHHSPSIGLDEYVQEAGRAGRDGESAKAVLLWHPYDFTINRNLIEKSRMELTGKERKERLDALDALEAYARDRNRCRWRMIRKFFGEKKGTRCDDLCDNCMQKDEAVFKLRISAT